MFCTVFIDTDMVCEFNVIIPDHCLCTCMHNKCIDNNFTRKYINLAHSGGFEPPTARFVAEYSIQLSYECVGTLRHQLTIFQAGIPVNPPWINRMTTIYENIHHFLVINSVAHLLNSTSIFCFNIFDSFIRKKFCISTRACRPQAISC